MDTVDMSVDLRLAAIITLLSSSALRGATANKTKALCFHLAALADAQTTLSPYLKDALEQAFAGWKQVQCHAASVAVSGCPLTAPGQMLH